MLAFFWGNTWFPEMCPLLFYDLDLWGFNFTPFQQFESEEEPATRVWGLWDNVFCLLNLGINVSMRYHMPPLEVLKHIEAWSSQAPDQWCAPKERAKFPVSYERRVQTFDFNTISSKFMYATFSTDSRCINFFIYIYRFVLRSDVVLQKSNPRSTKPGHQVARVAQLLVGWFAVSWPSKDRSQTWSNSRKVGISCSKSWSCKWKG